MNILSLCGVHNFNERYIIDRKNLFISSGFYSNTIIMYQNLSRIMFLEISEKKIFCFSFMHIIHQDHVLTYQGYSGWWKYFEGQIPFCYPFLYPHICMQEKNLMVESTRWKLLTFLLKCYMLDAHIYWCISSKK